MAHVIFHLSGIYLYLFQNVFEEEGGWEIKLILIGEQCVFSLLRELKIYHDICWLHSQNLSPPTTLEARQGSSVGAASSTDEV